MISTSALFNSLLIFLQWILIIGFLAYFFCGKIKKFIRSYLEDRRQLPPPPPPPMLPPPLMPRPPRTTQDHPDHPRPPRIVFNPTFDEGEASNAASTASNNTEETVIYDRNQPLVWSGKGQEGARGISCEGVRKLHFLYPNFNWLLFRNSLSWEDELGLTFFIFSSWF